MYTHESKQHIAYSHRQKPTFAQMRPNAGKARRIAATRKRKSVRTHRN